MLSFFNVIDLRPSWNCELRGLEVIIRKGVRRVDYLKRNGRTRRARLR